MMGIVGKAMIIAPVILCFVALLWPLFREFGRQGWAIFVGVLAWYALAFILMNAGAKP